MIVENRSDETVQDEMNKTIEELENDTKTFEDLEFQYLEEETEWLAYREELHNEQKTLTKRIEEKHQQIQTLENQGIDNQNTACVDTKNIEKDLWSLLSNLEKSREELKTIDTLLFELSGQKNTPSDSGEEFGTPKHGRAGDIMSQSLFGSQEILTSKSSRSTDLMSKSVNENLIFHPIEMPSFNESELCSKRQDDSPTKASQSNGHNGDPDPGTESPGDECEHDPLQKLKYNLSPPFEHKSPSTPSSLGDERKVNLNLSIESDDFEVNPLEKRVPSQDDIDRICKVTTDAPISTQGASFKVIESIKEIERNRQLLLAQQGTFRRIVWYGSCL